MAMIRSDECLETHFGKSSDRAAVRGMCDVCQVIRTLKETPVKWIQICCKIPACPSVHWARSWGCNSHITLMGPRLHS